MARPFRREASPIQPSEAQEQSSHHRKQRAYTPFPLEPKLFHNLTTTISRLTRSRRSQVRKRLQPCSGITPFWSSKSGLVTHPSLSPRLAPWVSCSTTLQIPRFVIFFFPIVLPHSTISILIGFLAFSFHRDAVLSAWWMTLISSRPGTKPRPFPEGRTSYAGGGESVKIPLRDVC